MLVPEIRAGLANVLPPALQSGGKCSDNHTVSLGGKVFSFAFMAEMSKCKEISQVWKQHCLPAIRGLWNAQGEISTSANILEVWRVGSIKAETLETRRSAVRLIPSPSSPPCDGRTQSLPPSEGRAVSVYLWVSVKSQDLKSGSHPGLQTIARNYGLVLKTMKRLVGLGLNYAGLSLNSSSATSQLCDLKEVTSCAWNPVSPSVKWGYW